MQKVFTKRSAKGFSLVELLAVVLILAVLAAVAVPLYINTRKSSAARACKANISAIAAAESAYALRNGQYSIDIEGSYVAGSLPATGLVGAPEGLSAITYCPLDNTSQYTLTSDQAASGAGTAAVAADVAGAAAKTVYIHCPNASLHGAAVTEASPYASWNKSLAKQAAETLP